MEKICRSGIVVNITGNMASIRIMQGDACAACSMTQRCGVNEGKTKTIMLPCKSMDLTIGQEVHIVLSDVDGLRGILLAFAIPLTLMFVALITVMVLTSSEILAAISAVAILVAYYVFLAMRKIWLYRLFSFQIEK